MRRPTAPLTLPLVTERLLLRPFEPDDLDHLARLQTGTELTRWVPWEPRTDEQVEASLLLKMAALWRGDPEQLALAAVRRDDGTFVGDFTLHNHDAGNSSAEIGFMVVPEHHRRGFATEAATAILGAGFEQLGLHRISARVEPRNVASWQVLERLGMRREAHFVENEWIKGEWQSEYAYAMLAREWATR